MGHDGARWAEIYGQSTGSLRRLADELWAGGGSLDIQIVSQADDHLDFNLTRCLYAQFYQQMGLADLGYRVHCSLTMPWWSASAKVSSWRDRKP
jgi:hypothetical protein